MNYNVSEITRLSSVFLPHTAHYFPLKQKTFGRSFFINHNKSSVFFIRCCKKMPKECRWLIEGLLWFIPNEKQVSAFSNPTAWDNLCEKIANTMA